MKKLMRLLDAKNDTEVYQGICDAYINGVFSDVKMFYKLLPNDNKGKLREFINTYCLGSYISGAKMTDYFNQLK